MPIRVKCENCKKTLSVKDHLAGKKIKCPVCQTVVLVAGAAPPAKEPTTPANPAAGKPAAATKPKPAKPATEKPGSNGTPANGSPKSNGVPAKPAEPASPMPPVNIEEEALSAFADEPKPEVEEGPPQTIDFTCPWCDEQLHLPLDMGGKQAPCPHEECKRIIKIPLPKVTEKKDWRKMDRRGPAAALVSQPEQLDNAWGTEEAVRARQASLAQAGVLEQPKKPGIGIYGWLGRAFYVICAAALLAVVGMVSSKLAETSERVNVAKEITDLLKADPPNPAKVSDPLLAAEADRTLAELYLQAKQAKVRTAKDRFAGARGLAKPVGAEVSPHKELFLIELALAQIDLGGVEEEWIAKNKLSWDDAAEEIRLTLRAIHPDVQMMAVREVATRLLERNQAPIATVLAGGFSNQDPTTGKRPLAAAQQIALLVAKDDTNALAAFGKMPDPDRDRNTDFYDAPLRVGYAEGFARKGGYQQALALVQMRGPAKDRLEAALGVAAIALTVGKNKDEAGKFIKEAAAIAKELRTVSPWQRLQWVRLALRTDEAAAAKDTIPSLPTPFKLRAQLEVFLAHCENTPGLVTADALPDIVPAEDKEGVTLALAWLQFARHNASKGATREQNRAAFDFYVKISPPPNPEVIRPMVDIGTYQGMRR